MNEMPYEKFLDLFYEKVLNLGHWQSINLGASANGDLIRCARYGDKQLNLICGPCYCSTYYENKTHELLESAFKMINEGK